MPHSDSIQRAVDYIEANLTGEISLYDVAGRAGFSVPHFYRLFKAATGHTVGGYVTKRRLAEAARALLAGGRTVADVAYEYGFGSHDVFTRAFAREYGMPPSRFRKYGAAPGSILPAMGMQPMAEGPERIVFEVIERPEFTVTGMRCSAMEWDEDLAVGRLWSAFLPRVEEIAGRASPMVMLGLCETTPTEPGRFSYMAAVLTRACAAPPPGMAAKRLRAQRFVEARIPERMGVRDAYEQTLAYARQGGYTVDDYDSIEVYEEIFRDPADHRFALWIPVKY